MGYQVEYAQIRKIRNAEKRRITLPVLTVLFLVVFFILVGTFWQHGSEIIREILIPGDPAVTVMALENLAQELQQGEPFGDAFAHFCTIVMEGTNIAPA